MADPVVGELRPVSYGLICAQPGGVGTPVTDPTNSVGEINGKFFPGCGHSINHWDIEQVVEGGTAKKLIKCPQCGYVQSIKPLSVVNDNDGGIIIA